MLGVLVNTGTVIIGSILGLLFKKSISEKVSKAVMSVVGLCTLLIGVLGAIETTKIIVIILSLTIGTVVGTLLKISDGIDRFGEYISNKFKKEGEKSIAEGLVTATLLFCVGAMTIVGAFEGANGNHEIYFTKAILDFVSSLMLASALGIGVLFAAIPLFLIQTLLVLGAGLLQGVMSPLLIAELGAVGSIMIIGLGLNLMGVCKLKIADMLPAFVFLPAFLYLALLIGL